MQASRLIAGWIVGLGAIAVLAIGPPDLLQRSVALLLPSVRARREAIAANTRDSLAAWRTADSTRRVRGDSVLAMVLVPRNAARLPERDHRTRTIYTLVLSAAILGLLGWKTRQWTRRSLRVVATRVRAPKQ